MPSRWWNHLCRALSHCSRSTVFNLPLASKWWKTPSLRPWVYMSRPLLVAPIPALPSLTGRDACVASPLSLRTLYVDTVAGSPPRVDVCLVPQNQITGGFVHLLCLKPNVEDRKANMRGHGHESGLQKQRPSCGMPLPPAPELGHGGPRVTTQGGHKHPTQLEPVCLSGPLHVLP